jgi:tRNA dimethylallyltransferase
MEKITLEQAVEKIKQNTRHYAKRQLTWFNHDKDIEWFHPDEKEEITRFIQNRLSQLQKNEH